MAAVNERLLACLSAWMPFGPSRASQRVVWPSPDLAVAARTEIFDAQSTRRAKTFD
jgi:hypothetical protein